MRNQRQEETAGMELKRPLLRSLLGVPILAGSMLIVTAVISRGWLGQGREALLARSALFLAATLSAVLCAFAARRRKLVSALLGESGLLLLLIALGVFTKTGPGSNMSFLISVLILISGGFAGGTLAAGGRKRRRSTRVR